MKKIISLTNTASQIPSRHLHKGVECIIHTKQIMISASSNIHVSHVRVVVRMGENIFDLPTQTILLTEQ